MNVGKCKCCNTSTTYDEIPVCEKCLKNFKTLVKNYLDKNGEKTSDQINQATGVPIRVIDYFIEKGVLYDTADSLNFDKKQELERYKTILEFKKIENQAKNKPVTFQKIKTEGKYGGFLSSNIRK
jgi:hypothetical protein